jgi:hypothetical protein
VADDGGVRGSDPADAALDWEQLDRLRQSAVYGAAAVGMVRSIAHS